MSQLVNEEKVSSSKIARNIVVNKIDIMKGCGFGIIDTLYYQLFYDHINNRLLQFVKVFNLSDESIIFASPHTVIKLVDFHFYYKLGGEGETTPSYPSNADQSTNTLLVVTKVVEPAFFYYRDSCIGRRHFHSYMDPVFSLAVIPYMEYNSNYFCY